MQKNKKDDIAEIRNLFFRYLDEWKWFAFSLVFCLGLAFLYLKLTPSVYLVNANVLIKEDDSQSGKGISAAMKNFSFGFPGSLDVEDELQVLSSFTIMRQSVKELELYNDYQEVKYLIKKVERYKDKAFQLEIPFSVVDTIETSLKFKLSVSKDGLADIKGYNEKKFVICDIKDASFPVHIQTIYGDFLLNQTEKFKKGKSYRYIIKVYPVDAATEYYKKTVDVSLANKKANVIALSMAGPNIEKSKILLNKLIELYNKDALTEKNLVFSNTATFIQNRLNIIAKELSEAETQVEQYKKNRKMFDMSLESKALLEQNNELQPKLIEVNSQLLYINQLQDYLSQEKNQYNLLPTAIGIEDKAAMESIQSYNKVVLERIKLLRNTSENNPAVITLNNQIKALRESVMLSIDNIRKSLQISLNELNAQNKTFLNRYQDAPTIEKEFLNIKRNQMIKEQLVIFLMEKREENALSLAVNAPKARVIDYAYKNQIPVSPNKKMILLLAAFLAILLPMVYFYLTDLFKTTFVSKDELSALTTLPILGEICNNEEKSSIVISKDSVSSIAELFRAIRNNINFIINKKSSNVILVTSTRSGEGKSFFSVNLSLSLALTNKKILLVGMDLRSPKLNDYFQHLNHKGLTNYLSDDEITKEEIIQKPFPDSNLHVINAGPIPPNPGELLLENRLDSLFESLRQEYDYIVIDSAPIGMVSDSFNIDRLSDMTLFVTRANYSDKQSIKFVESIVEAHQLKKVYLIVNDTKTYKRHGYGYGYGYGANTNTDQKAK